MGFDAGVRCALIVLGQTFLSLFFVWFCYKSDQDEAPPVPRERIGVNTCERGLLQLPRRSL